MGAVTLGQPALATPQTTNATVQVNPGTLTVTVPNDMTFKPVTLIGKVQETTETTPATISVNDFRGANTGWSLTAKITSFQYNSEFPYNVITLSMTPAKKAGTNAAADVAASKTLTATAASIAKVTDEKAASSAFITEFNPTAKVTIPANYKTGNYNATITWDLNEGPTV
ncbi:TPA: WxL domain-containing protein [Enterococcus faecalis]